jgi:hypothetical protein
MTLDHSGFVRQLVNDKKLDFQWGVFLIPKLTKKTSRFAIGVTARGYGGPTHIQYTITRETAERKGAVEACVDLLMWLTAPHHVGPMVKETQAFLPAVRIDDEYFAENLKFMKPALARGLVRCYWIEEPGLREWWPTMQYFLEGKYTRQDVVDAMTAAVERGMAEKLDEFKDVWHWQYDDQGVQTWEIPPERDEKGL